jgi:integrase
LFSTKPICVEFYPRTSPITIAGARQFHAARQGPSLVKYAERLARNLCLAGCTTFTALLHNKFLRPTSRLYEADRSDKLWTDDHIKQFFEGAPKHLHLPLMLALWTGQRQGDLLRLPWSAYHGERIRLRQRKGKRGKGRRVTIRVGAPLKAALDTAPRVATVILTTSNDTAWTEGGFRASWGKACEKAGIPHDLTFHDIRASAVTRLAEELRGARNRDRYRALA